MDKDLIPVRLTEEILNGADIREGIFKNIVNTAKSALQGNKLSKMKGNANEDAVFDFWPSLLKIFDNNIPLYEFIVTGKTKNVMFTSTDGTLLSALREKLSGIGNVAMAVVSDVNKTYPEKRFSTQLKTIISKIGGKLPEEWNPSLQAKTLPEKLYTYVITVDNDNVQFLNYLSKKIFGTIYPFYARLF